MAWEAAERAWEEGRAWEGGAAVGEGETGGAGGGSGVADGRCSSERAAGGGGMGSERAAGGGGMGVHTLHDSGAAKAPFRLVSAQSPAAGIALRVLLSMKFGSALASTPRPTPRF